MPETIQNKRVFSLPEVMLSVKKTLTDRYTSAFWIRAEMNKLNLYAQSGHCFPELVEKQDGRVIAEIKSVLWKEDYNRINARFLELLHEPLKDGINILFEARIQFDPVRGLSLRITDIDPGFSLGELEKERLMTISRLQREGLFDKNQSLSLPLLPKRIAIISVETSKGYSDFMKVLLGNQWDYGFFHMLFPAFLQGEKAVPSIIAQLNRIQKVIHHFDVVAIIRGGGGEVGLTCYNNYELARAIATYPIPVLTGIGHSTNETVSEMVAFKNAITPTELADFLIQQYHNYSVPLQEAENAVITGARRIIRENRTGLFNQARYLNSVTKNMLLGNRNALGFASRTLLQDSRKLFVVERANIRLFTRQVSKATISNLILQKRKIEELRLTMSGSVNYLVQKRKADLENIERLIEVLSPHHVLKRGYSITSSNGKLVTSISEIAPGDILITTLSDGTISSTINSTKTNQ